RTIQFTRRGPRGDRAEVYNDCEGLGRIDPALRYMPPASGVLKTTGVYRLVRIQEATSPASTIRSSQWKIEEPPTFLWLNKETAIRYVAAMRDKTGDVASWMRTRRYTPVVLRTPDAG